MLALTVGGAGQISADAATKKPAAKTVTKKPAAKKPAAKPAADPKPAAASTPVQKEIAALNASGKKFTYWYGAIFSTVAYAAIQDQIKSWAKARGIQVDAVAVNTQNTNPVVTAAAAAGTLPDALDMSASLVLQLGSKNLRNIQPLIDEMNKLNGGLIGSAEPLNEKSYAAKGLGVPYGMSGSLMYRRLDLLKEAGAKTTAPKTWEELMEAATKVMKGGAGFALGNGIDADSVMRAQFVGYGGRLADEAGKKCTLDTPETRDFLAFVKKWYDKGAYPASAVTEDGSWDNNMYLAGRTVFIVNPGSVYATMVNGSASWDPNPKMAKNTGFSAVPGGPKVRYSGAEGWLKGIPVTSKYPELGQDLIRFLLEIRNMQEYLEYAIFGPAYKGFEKFEYWDENVDPVHAGAYEIAKYGQGPSFPDVNNAAFSAFTAGLNMTKMVQRHIIDGESADSTIKKAQAVCQAIYDK